MGLWSTRCPGTRRMLRAPCHDHLMATDMPQLGLPVEPPVSPMLAAGGDTSVPVGPLLAYEPKWDGFRALIFRAVDSVIIQGRGGDDLAYAFPEIVESARVHLPERVVLDGELVIIRNGVLDFPAMGARIRPRSEAGGRAITEMSERTPATYIAFDLLAIGDESLMDRPYADRRTALTDLRLSDLRMRTTPATDDHALATQWFHRFEGGGLDGLIVKDVTAPYSPGKRALRKVKHQRTLDAVVAGWRGHAKNADEVGSLLLGLYDGETLHHVGVASGFNARFRAELTDLLSALTLTEAADHPWRGEATPQQRRPGALNRWSRGRSSDWHALPPDRVAEVTFDQFEGDRLRHVARWVRWRPDRAPASCTVEQIPHPDPVDIATFLS